MKQESKENPYVPTHQLRSASVEKDTVQKAAATRERELRMAFAMTFGTPEGRMVLKWLVNQCGWGRGSIGANPALGLDIDRGTLYNSARQSLYSEMRHYIPDETLKLVEFENINELLD